MRVPLPEMTHRSSRSPAGVGVTEPRAVQRTVGATQWLLPDRDTEREGSRGSPYPISVPESLYTQSLQKPQGSGSEP